MRSLADPSVELGFNSTPGRSPRSLAISADTDSTLSGMQIWESGDTYAEVIDVESGNVLYRASRSGLDREGVKQELETVISVLLRRPSEQL